MSIEQSNKENELQFIKVLRATDKELIKMYITGSNKFAAREMKTRGIL